MQLVGLHRLRYVREPLLHFLAVFILLHEDLNKVLRPQQHKGVRSAHQSLH